WTLVGTGDATAGPFNPNLTPFSVNFVIPPGVSGIIIHPLNASSFYTNGNGGGGAYGTSPNGNYSDANLAVRAGASNNAIFGGIFNPRIFNGAVQYQAGGGAAPEPVQTAGLP